MPHCTTEHQVKNPRPTDVLTSREGESSRVLATQSALRSNREATETRQDWAGVRGVTTQALTALEEAAFAATMAAERAFSFAEVLNEALSVLADAAPAHPAGSPTRDLSPDVALLSPREREVLALVAASLTNKAIAERLYVSPNTIKTHVASLIKKLRAESRVQLAAIAARQGLG